MKNLLATLLMALCVLIPQVARAACETPTHVAQLGEAGRAAEIAFANLDAEALLTQTSHGRAVLPCVDKPLTKQDAAAFHRLMAMEAFIAGDYTRAKQELHASLMLQPGYTFPADVAGEGHPLLALYTQAETVADGEGQSINPPPGGYVLVGGVRNAPRSSLTPVIVQVFASDATLQETRYVQPGEAVPNWGGNAFGLTAADVGINLEDLRRPSVLKDPRPWYVGAGVGAIASGVLYGVALQQKGLYQDPTTPDDQLADIESRANGLGTASLISGGTAVIFIGLGIGFHVSPGHKPGHLPGKPTLTTPSEVASP